MRWEHLRPGDMVHLISRLRRQLPLVGEAIGARRSQASPFQGRWLGGAETERLLQI